MQAPAEGDRESLRPCTCFGREEDGRAVLEALGPGRITTVAGRAGVGKTCLAQNVVLQLDDVVRVPLAGVATSDLVLAEIADRLGLVLLPGTDLAKAVAHELETYRAPVLFLDNFEHVVGAAADVVDLLDRVPGLSVLVTSQVSLHEACERVVVLAPLPVPDPEAGPEELLEHPAVALYRARAEAVDNRFELHEHTLRSVAELCGVLEGLPLAIELAAARSATLGPGEIVRRLEATPLDLLAAPRGDVPERHHGLRAAIRWTYDLLGPGEARLLRRLSLVPGAFGLAEAEALGSDGAAVDELETLVDFHLVDPSPPQEASGTHRFTMPAALRVFALGELDRLGERECAQGRYLDWVLWASREMAAGLAFGDVVAASSWIAEASAHLEEAAGAAIGAERCADAVEIILPAAWRWSYAGHQHAQEATVARVLAHSRDAPSGPRAHLLALQALLVFHAGDTTRVADVVALLDEAEELARGLGAVPALLEVLSARALTTPLVGDVDRAVAAAQEGHQLAREHGDDRLLVRFELLGSSLHRMAGDNETGLALALAGLRRARRSGYVGGEVAAGAILRPMVLDRPELDDVVPSTAQSVALARSIHMVWYDRALLPVLVSEALDDGDLAGARAHLAQAVTSVRRTGGPTLSGFTLLAASDVAAAHGAAALAVALDAALGENRPAVVANASPERAVRHAATLERCVASLEPPIVAAAVARGELLGIDGALDLVEEYLGSRTSATDRARPPGHPPGPDPPQVQPLTPRQRDVLRLLAAGLRNQEIAEQLWLSPKTVMHHTGAIYRALGVRGRSEATAWALRNGLG